MHSTRQGVRHSRSSLAPDTELGLEVDGQRWTAQVLDLSISGVRLVRPAGCHPLPASTASLSFAVEDQRLLELGGRLVRASESELAYRFDAPGLGREEALRALIARRGRLLDLPGE